MTRPLALTLAAAVLLLGSACSSNAGPQNGPLPSSSLATTVEVQNQNWSDVRIYVLHAGSRFRLGTVTSMARTSFTLPRSLQHSVTGIRIVAHPIGSNEQFALPTVSAVPGQTVSLRLENQLSISSVTVW